MARDATMQETTRKIDYSKFLHVDRINSETGAIVNAISQGKPVNLDTALLGIESATSTLELLELFLLNSDGEGKETSPIPCVQLQQIISLCTGQIRLAVAGIRASEQ
jgi:hypothetical protein